MENAARRIQRYTPAEAHASGAVLVDIRSRDAREHLGVIPGAIHVPRTVLEWRADPASEWRNPRLDGLPLIVICDHGYSSVLAAANLVSLGREAGDVIGGFEAWLAAGLPVVPAVEPSHHGLPGMGPPD